MMNESIIAFDEFDFLDDIIRVSNDLNEPGGSSTSRRRRRRQRIKVASEKVISIHPAAFFFST
jgi:hypothetical protein